MRSLFIYFALILCAVQLAAGQQASPSPRADQLVGLWKAKERYGPDARGTFIIQKTGSTYVADIMGRRLPVAVQNGELVLELPNKQGSFRGQVDGHEIMGHWTQPGTIANGFGYTMVSATPVTLRQMEKGRWIGTIDPAPDEVTFYLMIEKRPDGSLGMLIRNPERDLGNVMRIDRVYLEGDTVRVTGSRGQTKDFEWGSGKFFPDDGLLTLYFPSRGLNFVFLRDDDDSDFYRRGKRPAPYAYSPPVPVDDGWPTGTLESSGIDREKIEQLVQSIIETPETAADTPQIQGLMIARHGKLVLEEYFHGFTRDMLHNTRSASKSITATLVGAAIQNGLPLKLSSPVYQVMNGGQFPSDLSAEKRSMTLEHLLMMSSGIFCDDNNDNAPGRENWMWDQTVDPNFARLYLTLPLDRKPGQKSVYCSGDPNLALAMVGRATGGSQLRLFDRLVARPMKIDRYAWGLDRAGNPYGGGGMGLRLRDFAKFGQLMLNGGVWQGRRILSREWVTQASSAHTTIGSRKYGYLWWVGDYPYQGKTLPVYWALGAGGQNITVIPALDLVIATFSGSYATKAYGYATGELIPNFILPEIKQ
jgi:CubicO group peptidase (beta-lactamase class C family)